MGCNASCDIPLLIRVVDAQDELAAVLAGKQPIEQGGPHAADVQVTGRAGSKPCTNHRVFRDQRGG